RIAVVLCERFGELLKGPTRVQARKQKGGLFGIKGDDEGLSMRIGEAQQIYPEIWRHLDEARAAFAARGVALSAFDQGRAAEGILGIGANVDVVDVQHGFGPHAILESTKTANFNVTGHARARAACDALMRATPNIDWAGIAKAETEDPLVKSFNRS